VILAVFAAILFVLEVILEVFEAMLVVFAVMLAVWGLIETYSYYSEYKSNDSLFNDYMTLTHEAVLNNKRMRDLEDHILTLKTLNKELNKENLSVKEQLNKLNSIKLDELIEKMVLLDKII
jgi:hypothetical protein